MTEAEQVMKRCQIGTRNHEEANNLHAECYRVIGKLLAEKSMREVQRLGQEIEQCQCTECQIKPHASDCAVHSEPAYPRGKCDCGAQPEQEPVCDKDPQGCWNVRCQLGKKCKNTPPQRKPLTHGEIYTAYITATNQTLRTTDERLAFAFARAIEAAHNIKEDA